MAGCHQKAVLDPFLGSMPLTLLNALPFTVFVCTEQPLFSTLRIQFLSVCTEQPLFLSLPYTVFCLFVQSNPSFQTTPKSSKSVSGEGLSLPLGYGQFIRRSCVLAIMRKTLNEVLQGIFLVIQLVGCNSFVHLVMIQQWELIIRKSQSATILSVICWERLSKELTLVYI